jgi:hypothetical protein
VAPPVNGAMHEMAELVDAPDATCIPVAGTHEYLALLCMALAMASFYAELQTLEITSS